MKDECVICKALLEYLEKDEKPGVRSQRNSSVGRLHAVMGEFLCLVLVAFSRGVFSCFSSSGRGMVLLFRHVSVCEF